MMLNWTGAARADLHSIRATIARNSARYADRMLERITDNAARLVDLPYLGAVVPDYDNELREVFEHPYRIFYRVYPDRVDIVAVIHAARRLPGWL